MTVMWPTNGALDVTRIRHEIESLNARFAWLIDHAAGDGAPDLFTEDGVYALDALQLNGRDQIRAFYELRRAQGLRTSRHVFTNFSLRVEAPNRAVGTWVLTLYARDGAPPLPATPLAIMDYEDAYELAADGQWQFARRSVRVVFGVVQDLLARYR